MEILLEKNFLNSKLRASAGCRIKMLGEGGKWAFTLAWNYPGIIVRAITV